MLNVKDVRDHLQRPLTVTTRSSKSEQAGEDLQSKRPSNVPVLKFVVVGARGSGKSVFINRALDLRKSSQGSSNCKKMSLEGQVFFINLVETQLDDVKITENGKILWPRDTEDEQLSRADGVLALYDVTKQDSISRIPVLLNACSQGSIPCVLIASKCDAPLTSRRIDPSEVEQLCMEETGIESVQISIDTPDAHKRCISVVLRNFVKDQRGLAQAGELATGTNLFFEERTVRARARTTTHSGASNPRLRGKRAKHGRATSEVCKPYSEGVDASTSPRTQVSEGLPYATREPNALKTHDGSNPREPSLSQSIVQPRKEPRKNFEKSLALAFKGDEQSGPDSPDISPCDTSPGTPTTIANSFIEFSASQDFRGEESDDDNCDTTSEDTSIDSVGVTFEELVDRLLAPAMTKSDGKFAVVLLCLYRKFSSPSELFAAVWRRFEGVQNTDQPQLQKMSTQLRHLALVAQWLYEYPGDFAHPFLRSRMNEFLDKLIENRVFEAAAGEMHAQLALVEEDDDTMWECSDVDAGLEKIVQCFSRVPSMSGSMNALMANFGSQDRDWRDPVQDSRDLDEGREHGHSKSSSLSSSLDQSVAGSASTVSTPLASVEAAQRQAQLLNPGSRFSLTKIQWHQFMDVGDEDIARELTRIDWILYSSIRPRDLLRHVGVPEEEKVKYRCLGYVNRVIGQFNHVAFWVANMILLRDKAKHRAKMLEKFMNIAWKLRQLDNYNALGAIVAGINGIAVHRLAQTRELVSPAVQKDFMRLEILMSTQKSHFAYRLAWENTSARRIPFLPLHCRDLVTAEEGNRTFLGPGNDRINWKKFEMMGEIVASIRESQGIPYPHIHRNLDVQKLILDGRFSRDEDELYERSLSVEGPGINEPRRRFNWFQR